MTPIRVLLGAAALVLVTPFFLASDIGAAASLSAFPSDAVAFEQHGVQGSQPSTGDSGQPELDQRLFLPTVSSQFPQVELYIYDWAGNLQSWDWLISRFGAVWLHRGSGAAHTTVLREEASGQMALIASVARDGQPVQDVPVMFY